MSQVELVVTEARIWARGATTHWELPPSIMVGSNGVDLVVGRPPSPDTPTGSVVQFLHADAIALAPRIPTVVDAMAAVFATVLDNLRVAAPCERLTLICPTEWGAARQNVLRRAAARFATDVVFHEIGVRAVEADERTRHNQRTLVLEFGALTTTASIVVRSHRGVHIESCEYEPTLALVDIVPASSGFRALCALVDRLRNGRAIDGAHVVGVLDSAKLDLVQEAIAQVVDTVVQLRRIDGADLAQRRVAQPRTSDPSPSRPRTERARPRRDRTAARTWGRGGTRAVLAAGIALLAVCLVVATGAMWSNREDGAAALPSTATATANTTESLTDTTTTDPVETFGRIRFRVPSGWRIASTSQEGRTRVDLSPEDAVRQRITVKQSTLSAGSGHAQVAADLEAQIARRPTGPVTGLRRDVAFGGRHGLAYVERPGDGSIVHWYVMVESGIQVSVGCQYVDEGWRDLEDVCARFGDSVDIVP